MRVLSGQSMSFLLLLLDNRFADVGDLLRQQSCFGPLAKVLAGQAGWLAAGPLVMARAMLYAYIMHQLPVFHNIFCISFYSIFLVLLIRVCVCFCLFFGSLCVICHREKKSKKNTIKDFFENRFKWSLIACSPRMVIFLETPTPWPKKYEYKRNKLLVMCFSEVTTWSRGF